MQFDFLKKLLGLGAPPPATRPPPAPPAPPASPPSRPIPPAAPAAAPRAPRPAKATPLPEAASLLATSRALLEAAGAPTLAARVQVKWNPRMRSTAGMAYPGKSLVTLNPRLLPFGDEEVQRTLRHELAHLLAHERAGRRRIEPHGKEWRQACRDLGLPDEKRTHDLPLPRRKISRPHQYRCPGCGVQVARVKPLRGGAACLKCCRTHNRGRYDARFKFQRIPSAD